MNDIPVVLGFRSNIKYKILESVRDMLFYLEDNTYYIFNSKLIPNVDSEKVIGVRMPDIKKLAKSIVKNEDAEAFLSDLPHFYHEEDLLHGFIVAEGKSFEKTLADTEKFLPYINNWAVCDTFSPRIFAKNKDVLYGKILEWLCSSHPYTVRYGIGMSMRYFLDGEYFDEKKLSDVAAVKSGEYYVNMMIAWYFATALAKRYDETFPYIKDNRLDKWVHNKTIQKASESFRVSDEQKEELRALRRK